MSIQSRSTYAWRKRHEPECQHVILITLWYTLLLVGVCAVIVSLVVGMYLYVREPVANEESVVRTETLSREELRTALRKYEERLQRQQELTQ